MLNIPPEASEEELQQGLSGEVCPRTDCRLLGSALLEYFTDSTVKPVGRINEQVPSDCQWFTVPHTGERIAALQTPETETTKE